MSMDVPLALDDAGNSPRLQSRYLDSSALFLLLQILAFWSVWQSIAARFLGSGESPWEFLPLISLVLLSSSGSSKVCADPDSLTLGSAAVFLIAYTVSIPVLPSLGRAVLAIISLTFIISRWRFDSQFHLGVFGLLLLSLPLTDSLNFFLGYPMRVVVGESVAFLLGLQGMEVHREGVTLFFGEKTIAIDAPCSGVKMLWFGSLLAIILSLLLRIGNLRLLLVLACTLPAILLGNILRASALFYVEGGMVSGQDWMHAAIGVIGFAVTALVILMVVKKISEVEWRS